MVNTERIPNGYHITEAGILPTEWQVKKLNEVVTELTERAGQDMYETVSISAGIGFVNQAEKFGKELSGKQYEKYIVLHKGDFSYNKGNSKTSPQGCIYRLNDRESAAVPNVFESFRIKEQDADYYEQLFLSGFLNRQLYSRINRGVRDDGLLNLTGKDFYSCMVPVPPIDEQKQIAKILAQCDKVIELKEKCLEEEKRRKRWLVENILTGKIRLDKFSAPWEETTIGKCVEYLVGYPFASDKFTSGGIRLLRCSNVKRGCLSWEPSLTMYWREDDSLKPLLMNPGDIVVAMDGALIGRSFAVVEEADTPSYLVQRVARIRSKINDLIFQWISSDMFARHIDSRKTSTAIPHMTIKDILSFKISIPKSALEATVIGSTLQNQDKIIRLLTEEIHANKQQKKALMQLLLTGTVRVKT